MITNNYNSDTHAGPSFSLRNRVARMIWSISWSVFCRFSPAPFHEYRSTVLRLFGARVGKKVHVYPGVKIWAPWNIVLDDECGIGNGATIYSQGKISIGK